MSTINFKIDYNSVKTTNPEMGSEALARKSRYILENKLVFDDPVILRVGLYARLSVEDGDDEISDSIATQLAIGAGFFALNPELIHVKTYIDDGYSGLDFDRPDFQNMMDDLRTGLINCVVVKDVSRAGRNYKVDEETAPVVLKMYTMRSERASISAVTIVDDWHFRFLV